MGPGAEKRSCRVWRGCWWWSLVWRLGWGCQYACAILHYWQLYWDGFLVARMCQLSWLVQVHMTPHTSHGVSAVVTGKSSCLVRSMSRLLAGSRQQFHNNTSPAAAARTPARGGHIYSLKEIWRGWKILADCYIYFKLIAGIGWQFHSDSCIILLWHFS